MPGTAGKAGDYVQMVQAGANVSAQEAQLLEAFYAMQPQFRKALLDVAEVYAERYPIPKGVYLI